MESNVSRLVRPPQARALLGNIGNSTLWRWVKERPNFPQPMKLGPRVTVFSLDGLIAWRDMQTGAVPGVPDKTEGAGR